MGSFDFIRNIVYWMTRKHEFWEAQMNGCFKMFLINNSKSNCRICFSKSYKKWFDLIGLFLTDWELRILSELNCFCSVVSHQVYL